MRLADWDEATTARYRQLWRLANGAHEATARPSSPAVQRALAELGVLSSSKSADPAATTPEHRARWAVFFALSRLLSTSPALTGPERLLRREVHAHCDAVGQPLRRVGPGIPGWQAVDLWGTRSPDDRAWPVPSPPVPEALREMWERVETLARKVESVHGPVERLAPMLTKLRAEPEPSETLLSELWGDATDMIQREPENPVPARLLLHFDGERNRDAAWHSFGLPKRRGGTRTITTPTRSLKWLQRSVLQVLTHLFPRHRCAVGFERGRSVVTHAAAHAGKRWVYVVDIQDFFPSITRNRVYGMLRAKPFEASEPVARYLANLVTHDGALPQGAPTSPILANLLCRRMDSRLFKWARERGYQYTRYADDLAFSTNRAEFPEADRATISEIVEDEGFTVHPEKRKLMPWYGRQLVTGLVVNEKPNVPRETVRGLRALLFNIETFGWDSQVRRAQAFSGPAEWAVYKKRALPVQDFLEFAEHQRKERLLVRPGTAFRKPVEGYVLGDVPIFQRVVRGRIEFVGAVKGKKHPVYLRLREQYDRLVERERETTAAVLKGKAEFVPEEVAVPAESTGNYASVMGLIKRLQADEAALSDLYSWVEERAGWSLEADWLLRGFAEFDAAGAVRRARDLAYALDTHPARTAAFFRQFGHGRPFRRLLHDPMVPADADGRFRFSDGTAQSAAEIVGACEAVLRAAPLPNPLKTEASKVLRECREWVEVHPGEHPFVSDALHERLQTFKWEVRYDDEEGSDLWGQLEEEAAALREAGGAVEVDEGLPVFYTYTPNVTGRRAQGPDRPASVGALVRLLRSLVEKAKKKAGEGGVMPVRVSAEYVTVGGTEQAVVVLQATDGPVRVAPGLRNVLRGDTQSALHDVRGLARWTMEVPYADGSVRAYDVTQNAEVDPVNGELPGFRHVLTFYQ